MTLFGKRREVMYMDLGTLAYRDIPIIEEAEKWFFIKKIEKHVNRLWKGPPGWTGKNIRYLGCKGYPVVSWLQEGGERVEGTFKEFIEFAWGPAAWENLKPEAREAVENIGVAITVRPDIAEDQTTKYKLDRLQAEGLIQNTTIENLDGLGEHVEKKPFVQSLGEKIPWMALGGLILYLALHNNIIR